MISILTFIAIHPIKDFKHKKCQPNGGAGQGILKPSGIRPLGFDL